MEVLYFVLAAVAVFAAYVLIKAALFRPRLPSKSDVSDFLCDEQKIGEHLGEMIKLKTVSYRDMSQMDMQQFEEFPKLLERLYPKCAEALSFERAGITGLIYRWKGKSDAEPSILMAHYDVVPVEEEKWSFPPFCGEIRNENVLGRGALDTKNTLCAIFEAVEMHISEGFVPQNDIYLCFSGTEEIAGEGAHEIVKLLGSRGIHPVFTLDEGGAIVSDILPGVSQQCAIVGLAEKGQMVVRVSAKSRPGHASMPPKNTAVGKLAKVICAIEKAQFKAEFTPAVLSMIDTMGRFSDFGHRIIYASPKLFLPLIEMISHSLGGEINALLRTTVAFTMTQGSKTSNVLPSSASATCDVRVLTGMSCEQVIEHFKNAVNDPDIEFEVVTAAEPSLSSPSDGRQWELLSETIARTWENTVVSPYLMVARSDSTVYTKICDNVYRFAPIALSLEESATIHAADERIPLSKLAKSVEFYHKLIAGL